MALPRNRLVLAFAAAALMASGHALARDHDKAPDKLRETPALPSSEKEEKPKASDEIIDSRAQTPPEEFRRKLIAHYTKTTSAIIDKNFSQEGVTAGITAIMDDVLSRTADISPRKTKLPFVYYHLDKRPETAKLCATLPSSLGLLYPNAFVVLNYSYEGDTKTSAFAIQSELQKLEALMTLKDLHAKHPGHEIIFINAVAFREIKKPDGTKEIKSVFGESFLGDIKNNKLGSNGETLKIDEPLPPYTMITFNNRMRADSSSSMSNISNKDHRDHLLSLQDAMIRNQFEAYVAWQKTPEQKAQAAVAPRAPAP